MNFFTRFSLRSVFFLLISSLCLTLLAPDLCRAQGQRIPLAEAERRIKVHIETINQREQAMGEIYSNGPSEKTVLGVLQKAGCGDGLAHSWGMWLMTRWLDSRAFYVNHRSILETSLMAISGQDTIDAGDLTHLDAGMLSWASQEKQLAKTYSDLLDNWGKQAAAMQNKDAKAAEAAQNVQNGIDSRINQIVSSKCFTPLLLIYRVNVDYQPGKNLHNAAIEKLNKIEIEIKAQEPIFRKASDRLNEIDPLYNRAYSDLHQALQTQSGLSIDLENAKFKLEYMEELAFIDRLKSENGSPETFQKEYDKRDRFKEQFKEREMPFDTSLQGLRGKTLDAEVAKARQLVSDLRTKYDAAHETAMKANENFVRVRDDFEVATALYHDAAGKLEFLKGKFDVQKNVTERGRLEGIPLLTGVEISGGAYSGSWWNPYESLEQVDQRLREVSTALDSTENLRDSIRKQWLDAKINALAKLRATENLVIYSLLAQFGVEAGDFMIDIVKECVTKGLVVGGIKVVTKKAIDLGVEYAFAKSGEKAPGGYKFLNPEELRRKDQEGANGLAAMRSEAYDIGRKYGKKILVDQICKNAPEQVASLLSRSQRLVTVLTGKLPECLAGVQAGVREFAVSSLSKDFNDITISVMKSYAKGKLKMFLDEKIQAPALLAAFQAEDYALAMHHLYVIARDGVDALRQEELALQSVHDYVIGMYQQNEISYFKGEGRSLEPDKTYTLKLTFRGANPTSEFVQVGPRQGNTDAEHKFTFSTKDLAGRLGVTVMVTGF